MKMTVTKKIKTITLKIRELQDTYIHEADPLLLVQTNNKHTDIEFDQGISKYERCQGWGGDKMMVT